MWCSWSGRSWINCYMCSCTLSVTNHSWHAGIRSQMLFFFPSISTHTCTHFCFLNALKWKRPFWPSWGEKVQCFIWNSDRKPVWGHDCSNSAENWEPWAVEWIHHIPQHRGRVGLCSQHPWQKRKNQKNSWSSFLLALWRRPQQCHPAGMAAVLTKVQKMHQNVENAPKLENGQCSLAQDGVMPHILQTLQCLGGGKFSRTFTVPHFCCKLIYLWSLLGLC